MNISNVLSLTVCSILAFSMNLAHAAGKPMNSCAVIEKTCKDYKPAKSGKKNPDLWKECVSSIMLSSERKSKMKSAAKFPALPRALVAECKLLKPKFGNEKLAKLHR